MEAIAEQKPFISEVKDSIPYQNGKIILLPERTASTLSEFASVQDVFNPYIESLRSVYNKAILSNSNTKNNLEQLRRSSQNIRFYYGSKNIPGSDNGNINLENLNAKNVGKACVNFVQGQLLNGFENSKERNQAISTAIVFLVYQMVRLEEIGYQYRDSIESILTSCSRSVLNSKNVWFENFGGNKNKYGLAINPEILTPNLQHAVDYINKNYFGYGAIK